MGYGDKTTVVPLEAGETWVAEGFGAVGHKTGGKLIVTDQRLLFQPWDLGLAATLIKWGCKALQVPHAGVVNYIVGRAVACNAASAQGAGGIVAVDAVGMARFSSLPKIRVTKDDGTVAEFGVGHSPTTMNSSAKNNVARDALVNESRSVFL